jgi:hypothetical protein
MFAESHRNLFQSGERLLGHAAAIVLGLVLMLTGIALGVTIVMLPIGIPVGLIGLALFLWGLVGPLRASRRQPTDTSP